MNNTAPWSAGSHDINRTSDNHDWPDLEKRITMNLNSLSRVISLPGEMAVHHVGRFVLAYCDYQQRSLTSMTDADSRALRVLINRTLASRPELASHSEVDRHSYVDTLKRAYFVLRVQEEAADRYRRSHRKPLTSHDLSTANMIIYCLLGDRIASQIDSLVCSTLSGWMPGADELRPAPAEDPALVRICQSWPCLAGSLGLPSLLLAD